VVTFIPDVVAPVDHKYVVPALDVSVTLPPVQKVVGPPAEIVGADGKAFTVTAVGADDELWHPFALVTLTV
jgi:hypothetical protein